MDTAIFLGGGGDSKDLLLQFLFLNFFSYILPGDKQTGEIPNERLKNKPLDPR